MSLQIESHHFDPRPLLPLQLTAKRYTWSNSQPKSATTYTLVLLHGAGFIKESWEPILRRLYEKSSTGQLSFQIDEAWAIDCPNHGESAALNEKALSQPPYTESFETTEWALGTYHLLNARLGLDGGLKPSSRKIIGIGHSAGAVTMLHLAYSHPTLLTSMVLLDPILYPHQFSPAWAKTSQHLVASAYQRRDVWSSRKAALKDLSTNAFKSWDAEELELYVEHGLRAHTGARYDFPYNGVTLCTTREYEAAIYRGNQELRRSVLDSVPQLTQMLPIYVAFGEINDSVPRKVQDLLVDRSTGNNFVNVARIPNAGHLVVQQSPAGCADAVFNALSHLAEHPVYIPNPLPDKVESSLTRPRSDSTHTSRPAVQLKSRL